MKDVTIRYRVFGWLPVYRTVKGSFPQNWGEVTAKQLVAVGCLYKNRISDLMFLKRMSGLPVSVLKRCDDYERFKLMEQLEFVGDRKPFHAFIIRKLEVEIMGKLLYGPADKLSGVSFGQFIFADSYFNTYLESQQDEDLNKFIACLYIPMSEKFDHKSVIERADKIGRLDKTTREAIVINWQLVYEWLGLAYPLIFQKREQIKTENKDVVENRSSPWIKIFQNFVGDDILHDDEWAAKPINTIFTFMTRKYKENARRKK